jgi:hypothetical protein
LQPLREKYPLIVPELDQFFPNATLPYYHSTKTGAVSTRWNQQQIQRRRQRHQLWRRLYFYPALLHASKSNNSNPYSLAVSTIPMTASTSGPTFFKYLLVFTAGGLFFSTVVASVYAVYGLGMENVKRIFDIFGLVLKRVWISFTVGLGTTRLALLGKDDNLNSDDAMFAKRVGTAALQQYPEGDNTADPNGTAAELLPQARDKGRWKWKKAWNTLREELIETGRTATQGVRAIRQERTRYTAVVGQRGLVPIQYTVAKLMPYSVSTIMENALRDTLKNIQPSNAIKKMTLKSFSAGRVPPTFLAARAYDVENCIAIDFDIDWTSEVEAKFNLFIAGGLAKIPVSIKSIDFSGVVRVILTPLRPDPPGYGATLISFPTSPHLSLDVKVLGGELTKLPFLRKEITSILQRCVKEELLWPRRNVVPMLDKGRQILTGAELQRLREMDPFLLLEQTLVNSNEPMVRDIRERLLPARDALVQPFISILDNVDNKNLKNSTRIIDDSVREGKRNNWFERSVRAKKNEVLTRDIGANNATHLSQEEGFKKNETDSTAVFSFFSIESQILSILGSISKCFEDFVSKTIIGQSVATVISSIKLNEKNSATDMTAKNSATDMTAKQRNAPASELAISHSMKYTSPAFQCHAVTEN